MSISCHGYAIRLDGFVDVSVVPELRMQLAQLAPDPVVFQLEECRDMHTGVLQVLLAYKALFGASFVTDRSGKAWQKALEGFWLREDGCC
ncbi:MAG: hypothetical protein K6347_06460 [Campylobacterales bacterium]